MPENDKCLHPTGPPGGRGGKQKEHAVKLVVCIGGGGHAQAINRQAKTCFDCHRNKMLENHDCQHPTGPQRQTEKNSVGWGLGGQGKEAGAGGRGGVGGEAGHRHQQMI